MRFGRGGWHWYDFILVGLAAMIVYPDRILEWLGERTGRSFGWMHLLVFEAAAITLMVVVMVWLTSLHPSLAWWHAMLYVGMLALFRVISWGVARMFGFGD